MEGEGEGGEGNWLAVQEGGEGGGGLLGSVGSEGAGRQVPSCDVLMF